MQNHYAEGQPYLDEGSASEVYADAKILEMESLSPMTAIQPGSFAELVEDWSIISDISTEAGEAELDAKLPPVFS